MLLKKNIDSILDIRKFEHKCRCLYCKYNGTCEITKVVGSKNTLQDICMITRQYGRYYFIANRLKTKYLVMK